MFRYFFSSAKKRFENTPELKELTKKIEELRTQEAKLRSLVANNAAHASYQKSRIVTDLLMRIESAIDEFNKLETKSIAGELENIATLTKKIDALITSALINHRDILDKKRDNNKEIAINTMMGGAFAGAIGAGVATGSFLAGVVVFKAAYVMNDHLFDSLNLNDKRSKTIKILEDIASTISLINTNESVEFKKS